MILIWRAGASFITTSPSHCCDGPKASMKPRVLMVAYACDPQGSGEHWLGWGWAEQAARSFEVELITTPKARAAVEASCQPLGIISHFLDVPKTTRKLSELFGASWWRKLAWQKKVGRLAAVLQHEK